MGVFKRAIPNGQSGNIGRADNAEPSSVEDMGASVGNEALALSPFVSQKLVPFMARPNKEDLTILRDLMKAGKVAPVIDRRYRLSEAAEAIRYLETGHARGKVVVTMENSR